MKASNVISEVASSCVRRMGHMLVLSPVRVYAPFDIMTGISSQSHPANILPKGNPLLSNSSNTSLHHLTSFTSLSPATCFLEKVCIAMLSGKKIVNGPLVCISSERRYCTDCAIRVATSID